ncbi:MAG: 4Fe-4S dicluster domain-containing protein, partial [Bacteroidaceae bacterium]|nr:4Fe-4S dicluster domain-containing protein [Bacteroidaceae bacterium]
PMMGKALVNTDVPICKGSSGVLIMNEKEARRGEPKTCIRCAKCVGACPMGLEPYLLATLSQKQLWDKCLEEDIPYRLSVAYQNTAYNQPTQTGFYLGPDKTVRPFLKNK